FTNTPLVYTEHNTNNRRRSSVLMRTLDKIIYKAYAKIITIAVEVDREIKQHLKFDLRKFKMIYNGIDTVKYADAIAADKLEFGNEDDKFLIQISSFREPKDQKTVIRALQDLPDHVK